MPCLFAGECRRVPWWVVTPPAEGLFSISRTPRSHPSGQRPSRSTPRPARHVSRTDRGASPEQSEPVKRRAEVRCEVGRSAPGHVRVVVVGHRCRARDDGAAPAVRVGRGAEGGLHRVEVHVAKLVGKRRCGVLSCPVVGARVTAVARFPRVVAGDVPLCLRRRAGGSDGGQGYASSEATRRTRAGLRSCEVSVCGCVDVML